MRLNTRLFDLFIAPEYPPPPHHTRTHTPPPHHTPDIERWWRSSAPTKSIIILEGLEALILSTYDNLYRLLLLVWSSFPAPMDRFHHSERYMAESVASRGLAIDCSGRPDLQFLHGSLQHAVGQGHQRGVALVFPTFFPPVSVPGRSFQGKSNNKQLFIRPLDLRYTHFLQVYSNNKRLFIYQANRFTLYSLSAW